MSSVSRTGTMVRSALNAICKTVIILRDNNICRLLRASSVYAVVSRKVQRGVETLRRLIQFRLRKLLLFNQFDDAIRI